jgi:hypothetical protein
MCNPGTRVDILVDTQASCSMLVQVVTDRAPAVSHSHSSASPHELTCNPDPSDHSTMPTLFARASSRRVARFATEAAASNDIARVVEAAAKRIGNQPTTRKRGLWARIKRHTVRIIALMQFYMDSLLCILRVLTSV